MSDTSETPRTENPTPDETAESADDAPELNPVEARQSERKRGMPAVLVISTALAALALFVLLGLFAVGMG